MLDEARTAVFSMSMDSAKKKEMEDFFENLGLTLTSGVNIFFEASVIWAKMPFEVSREETEIPDMTGEEQPAGRARKEARFSMRMQPTRKRQVEYLYKELGMTLSQAVNIYFEACLREYGIPFRIGYPKPNAETLAALKDDALETYDSFDDYLAAMHALVDKDED
jgi:DNA-damage-inducible protein J